MVGSRPRQPVGHAPQMNRGWSRRTRSRARRRASRADPLDDGQVRLPASPAASAATSASTRCSSASRSASRRCSAASASSPTSRCVAFLPKDDGEPAWIEGRSRATTIVLTAVLGDRAVSTLSPPAFLLGPGLFGVAAVHGRSASALYRALRGRARRRPGAGDRARHARPARARRGARAPPPASASSPRSAAAWRSPSISIFAGLGADRRRAARRAAMAHPPGHRARPAARRRLRRRPRPARRRGRARRTGRPPSPQLRPEYRLGVGQHRPRPARAGAPRRADRGRRCASAWARRACASRSGACVLDRRADRRRRGRPARPRRTRASTSTSTSRRARAGTARELLVNADIGVGHLQIDRPGSALRVRRGRADRTLIVAGLATIALGTLLLLDRTRVIDVRFDYMLPGRARRVRRRPALGGSVLVSESTAPTPDRRCRCARRDPAHGYVAGVCAGFAARLGIDPLLIRIGFVLRSPPAAWASRSTRSGGR